MKKQTIAQKVAILLAGGRRIMIYRGKRLNGSRPRRYWGRGKEVWVAPDGEIRVRRLPGKHTLHVLVDSDIVINKYSAYAHVLLSNKLPKARVILSNHMKPSTPFWVTLIMEQRHGARKNRR